MYMVTLCGLEDEVYLGPDQTPLTQRVVNIGLTYDHRVVNGREAVAMLCDIKQDLESLDRLVAVVGSHPLSRCRAG